MSEHKDQDLLHGAEQRQMATSDREQALRERNRHIEMIVYDALKVLGFQSAVTLYDTDETISLCRVSELKRVLCENKDVLLVMVTPAALLGVLVPSFNTVVEDMRFVASPLDEDKVVFSVTAEEKLVASTTFFSMVDVMCVSDSETILSINPLSFPPGVDTSLLQGTFRPGCPMTVAANKSLLCTLSREPQDEEQSEYPSTSLFCTRFLALRLQRN